MRKKIAIIDPASYALPYDYFYIKSLCTYYDIDFYCSHTKYNPEYIEKIKSLDGVNVYLFNVSNTNKFVGTINYLRLLFFVFINKYLAVNFQWSILGWLDIPLLYSFKSKLIFTFHNSVPHDSISRINLRFKIIARLSKRIIFVSEFTFNDFISRYGNNFQDKSHILNHGIMPANESDDSCNNNHPPKKFDKRIIFWGNVKKYKGVEFLCHSIPLLKVNGYTLEVYGKFDSELIPLFNEIQRQGVYVINDYLPMSEVASLLCSNAILVLPYKNASQSGVMYTALYYGMPFISSNCGEAKSFLVKYGLSDLVFEYSDQSSLIKAINYFCINEDLIREKLFKARKEFMWIYKTENLTRIFG